MNRKLYIFFSIWSTWIFAFTFHDNLIPMTFNGETLDIPFLGGFNRPKIQWVDWDNDGDIDIFILDAGGYLRYLENQGNSTSPDFHLITTTFQNIYCGGWFYIADFDFDGDRNLVEAKAKTTASLPFHEKLTIANLRKIKKILPV